MKGRHPLVLGAALAVGHFLACLCIVPLTLRIGGALPAGPGDSLIYHFLALVTKVLYFPILAMALYPRHWFPGQMIVIPIAVNSLLWGALLVVAMVAARRLRAR